jgi:hypothetical protein
MLLVFLSWSIIEFTVVKYIPFPSVLQVSLPAPADSAENGSSQSLMALAESHAAIKGQAAVPTE